MRATGDKEMMPKPVVTTQPDRAPEFILSARAGSPANSGRKPRKINRR